MVGIPVGGPAYTFRDNNYILVNSSKPTSVLMKKPNSIAYNLVMEGCAADEWRISYVNTNDNVANLLSKSLANGESKRRFINMVLHHIY